MLRQQVSRRARSAVALAAALALSACGDTGTTEAATNAWPLRAERTVSGWFGGTVSPPPVVETPPAAPNERQPNLGDIPPRPRVSSPEERYTALAELTQERADNLAESQRIAATSPFGTEPPAAAAVPGIAGAPPAPSPVALQPATPIAIGAGRSVATVVFDTNSASIGEPQRQAARAAAAQLRGAAGRVRVIGFAGAGLQPQEGAELAHARAEAVAAELRAAGVPAARITVQAPGTGSGRQVEIVVDL